MSLKDEANKLQGMLNELNDTPVNIALFGQPGAGKSSLINKLIGTKLTEVGVETDKTDSENSYQWLRDDYGLNIIDLPGYGTSKFPKDEFRKKFDILNKDLFLCVFSGKFRQEDSEFLNELKSLKKECIFVSNKCDVLFDSEGKDSQSDLEKDIVDDLEGQLLSRESVIFTSCKTELGLDHLSKEIMKRLEGAKRERWIRSGKAYSLEFLENKREITKKQVWISAGISAANGVNPIPGVDISVDISILLLLFKSIKDSFGLNDIAIQKDKYKVFAPLAKSISEYLTKEGVLLLIKKYATEQTLKQFGKYIPLVGPVIAGSIGFAVTLSVGKSYLNDCYELAKGILEIDLKLGSK